MRDNQTFPNDPQQEEIDLEKSGDICALQRHRWDVWLKQDIKDWKLDFIRVLFITETRLRENTQREMMLREKLQRLEESPTHYKAAEIQDLRDKIQISSEQYWWKERFWWVVRVSFLDSPFTRGIDFWRSEPKWYMHRVLVEDCAPMGGCCGRNCGCCSSRENILGRKLAAGHCTVECSCCEKARGFELSPKLRSRLREWPDPKKNYVHYRRIRNISLLGVTGGSCKNPLDEI